MNKLTKGIYLFLLVFSPLAFGTVTLWSRTIMEGLSFLALSVFFVDLIVHKRPFYRVPAIIPLLLLFVYMLVQMIPLPQIFVKGLSPGTYGLYQDSLGLLGPIDWIPLSIDQKSGLTEFFRYGSYACFYILSIQLLSDTVFLKKVVNTVVLFVTMLAFLAILQHFTSDNKLYWFKEHLRQPIFGPYGNRNHFAGLVGMTFPLVLSMFLYKKPHINYTGLRTRLGEFFSYKSANTYLLLGIGLVLLGLAVFLSLSRGGIISLCVSTCLFGVLLAVRKTDRGRGLMVLSLFSMVFLTVGWFGWEPIFERFNRIRSPAGEITEPRLPLWKDSIAAIRDYPLTGTGFGTFTDTYKGYRTLPGNIVFTHAHNDYIELAVEGGMIAVGLTVWFLISILATYRRFLRRRDSYCIYLYMGGLTGLTAILIHSITDFNLHIGANGLYFFFVCAICVSAAHTRIRSGPNPTYLKPINTKWLKLAIVPAAALFVSSLVFNGGEFLANRNLMAILSTLQKDELKDSDYMRSRSYAADAITYDPFNSLYYAIFADAEKALHREEKAFEYYQKALWLSPANSAYLQALAQNVSDRGDIKTADALYRTGTRRDKRSSFGFADYAFWLLKNNRRDKGLETMQHAIRLSPRSTRLYLDILIKEKLLEDKDLSRVLPKKVEPHILFAEYLAEENKPDSADAAYKNAMRYLDNETEIKPSVFFRVCKYYMKNKAYEAALEVMQKGMEYLPDNARIRVTAGSLYEKLDINYRAVEEYQKALVLDPRNKQAKKRLERLE